MAITRTHGTTTQKRKPIFECARKRINSAPFAVVIIVIPVAVAMPTVAVFIPPPVAFLPAVLPRFVQFMAPMSGLLAPVSVMLNRFVELVIGTRDPTPATAVGAQVRRAGQ